MSNLMHHPRLNRVFLAAVLTLLGSTFASAQQISSITIAPNPASVGDAPVGTVALTKAAGTKGLKITLSSNESSAKVPASLTIASGETSGTFSISLAMVAATTKVTIKGVDPTAKSAEAELTIDLPAVRLTELSISPATVTPLNSATGTITLSASAPSDGFVVNLSSAATSIVLPKNVTVPSGAKTVTFPIGTHPVTADSTATILGTDPNGYTASSKFALDPPAIRLSSIKFAATSVTAANPATATITLTANAPAAGLIISLSTAQSFITVPASVTVKSGSKTATFTVVTKPVTTAGAATITGSDANSYSATATLTVKVPAVRLTGLSISPTAINSGTAATGTVTLSAAAPTGGFVVNLSTMQSVISLPMNVTVPAGSTTSTFTISANTVTASSSATVAAVDNNEYTASASLTVSPQSTSYPVSMTNALTFSPQSITVPAGSTVTWTNTSSFMNHTVTADLSTPGLNSNSQYPNAIPPGKSFSWSVPPNAQSGTTYYYHCILHGTPGNGTTFGGGMTGVVIVK